MAIEVAISRHRRSETLNLMKTSRPVAPDVFRRVFIDENGGGPGGALQKSKTRSTEKIDIIVRPIRSRARLSRQTHLQTNCHRSKSDQATAELRGRQNKIWIVVR
jgi:hypothetical protein